MLTFNYSPVSILADKYRNTSHAYKSSTTQSYYPNSSTSSESNISSANYPSSLKDYFTGSDRNFNIATYYNERYYALYSSYFEKYIASEAIKKVTNYKDDYDNFLKVKGYDTLYEYYTANSSSLNTSLSLSDFRGYAEYFVSNSISWTSGDVDKVLNPLFPQTTNDIENSMWRSDFYNSFQNFVNETNYGYTDNDGIDEEHSDFYTYSKAYNKLKTFIDTEIEKTIAIYTYNGSTQNKNVAAILANGAPTELKYYYKDSTYETVGEPSITYKKTTYNSITKTTIYYFGTEDEISGTSVYSSYGSDYFSVNDISILQKEPILYRLIKQGEDGYIDSNHATYYKYDSSSPYLTNTNSNVEVYVVNDNPTAAQLATYSALYYNVITSDDLTADTKGFYVQVPYSTSNTTYFETISGYTNNSNYFNNYVSLFTKNTGGAAESIIYLKLRENSDKVVYLDTSTGVTVNDFQTANDSYTYKVIGINMKDDLATNGETMNDYYEVDSSFSSYYKAGYKLYFKKIRTNYTIMDTSDEAYEGYETTSVANIPFEKDDVPTDEFYKYTDGVDAGKLVIYVVADQDVTINDKIYEAVNEATISKITNEFIKVPESVSTAINGSDYTYDFYYRHKTENINKIYIVDDDDDASDNEVYKNLHYTVITSSEYKANFSDYSVISSSDGNYNANFKLYYKYDDSVQNADLYVQNEIVDGNAIFIIDDSLTTSDKTAYKLNNYTVITTSEYNAESEFYVQITETDDNYSTLYTKLYYKYNAGSENKKVVYLYSSSSSSVYSTFYSTDSDYVAADYELIEPTSPDYVEGTELYYKKLRKAEYSEATVDDPQTTYFYYKTSSTVSLKAASYYMISFYVYTNGSNDGHDVEAAVYLTDTSNVISEIAIDKISTNGKWQKYCFFVATDSLSTSAVNLSFYMGNKDSILGSAANENISSITGTVLFDDVKITLISATDYEKKAVDDKPIYSTALTEGSEDEKVELDGRYADDYNNEVFVANEMNKYSTNVFDNITKNNISVWNSYSWNDMFNLDGLTNIFGDGTDSNTGSLEFVSGTDGFTSYDSLWQYYIGRDVSGQGNNYVLSQYQTAYENNKVNVSVIDEESIYSDKEKLYEKDEDEDDDSDSDSDDVSFIKSTFKNDNKILKIQNTDKLISLGVTSNVFTIEQSTYYKLTVWIYATDKESTATITLNSILKTASSPVNGTLLQTTASVDACVEAYDSTPTNEYGWIPISFYIQGNALHDQDVSLALAAGKNSTVYFDNISIERVTSATYDTISSDSSDLTYVLSLTPSTSVVTNGITNGYFNNVSVTSNYTGDIDYTTPKTANSWTVETGNSSSVVAGVVPTSTTYTHKAENFYTKYNDGLVPDMSDGIKYNIFGIYAPKTVTSPIDTSSDNTYETTSIYKIYSSSMSLSANSVYKISFDFYAGNEFDGTMISNLYYSSVATDKIISTLSTSTFDSGWNTYSFYIATGTASATIYLEFGVQNAVGTCFFKNASSVSMSGTLDSIRDDILTDDENTENDVNDLLNKDSLKNIEFVSLANSSFTIHGSEKDTNTNAYTNNEYKNELSNTSSYTAGKTGVVVASYYESSSEYSYTVTIDSTTYYLGEVKDDLGNVTGYKLYSDSTRKTEVTQIDNKDITIPSSSKVVVGTGSNETEYDTTSTENVTYDYKFTDDVVLNNNFISASELNNKHSQNVLILANGTSTDYTLISPIYTNSLKTSSYYVLKIYVKTSDFDNDDFGLTINVKSISTTFSNINTTKVEKTDETENGFVCYQVVISTNTSSISSLAVTFALGSETQTGTGYAIIAGVNLETFSSETLFNEYVDDLPDDDTTIKKFYGTASSTSDSSSDTDDEDAGDWTATFFYVFSSLLLAIVLIVALVAVFFKKHPIKIAEEHTNDHERDGSSATSKRNKNTLIDVKEEENDASQQHNINGDEGFV
jgi:hypothetical protein